MRVSIETWLLRHWYGNSQPPWYLRLFVPLYRFVFRHNQKRAMGRKKKPASAIPLVVIGNITAGGSGKTPLVIAVCRIASDMNLKAGIISTGYGRKSKQTMLVDADSDPRICGDEPVLLAQRTRAQVCVATDRFAALIGLAETDVDIIISDDGLQQADLPVSMTLCVVDGARGLGNGCLIPAGPLRESADRLTQVDFVISNGEWASKPAGLDIELMQLKAPLVVSLDGKVSHPIDVFREMNTGAPVHALAGIGNPGRFFSMLEQLGFEVIPRPFTDHHRFTSGDFDSIPDGAVIIMTEKDAVKCRRLALKNAWYVPVDTQLPDSFVHAIGTRMAELTRAQA